MDKKQEERLKFYAKEIERNNKIKKEVYENYNIKRGLRNKNGTGVLVGVTQVGDVSGYKIIDNKKIPSRGELYYRGYPLTEIVEDIEKDKRLGFEEVIYLLLFSKLANEKELESFKSILVEERALAEGFFEDIILKVPGSDIMNKMMRSLLALYTYDKNPDGTDALNVLSQSLSLISKIPILAVYSYQVKIHNFDKKSLIIHNPDDSLTIAENILQMLRNNQAYERIEAEILDLMLIIHAEHGGGNNSAFATHVVSSSGTDTYSAIAAGLASLKGPKHGGANLKVSRMLKDIRENVDDLDDTSKIRAYLEKILNKKSFDKKGLIYGLGHAVYTLSDPRAILLKKKAKELSILKGREEDFYFIENVEKIGKDLISQRQNRPYPPCANVDLYSGFVYDMLNIPEELYLPMFAIARTVGWSAHRLEQIQDEKIIRPAYKSLNDRKDYVPLGKRK
ncbi:MAG: citrate/2-methylcitrate synthase [Anaerococcus prevotii]|uniref:citrate/2-methylcitrate synthase n=1 Tax=Anaerococcus prevotii TaxID=33034 RepID=UPI00290298CC|nr:citrate/2-methylcitrate synthase [Anaerococcus prevotii]MDU2558264.1 citrate/2-methylcitrate synthase [Anaerococcus prevotii]